jgi:putative CocE/NonD family hydrolase
MTAASHTITVEFDVPAQMRDGTTLRANIFRPVDAGRYPVLLTRTPYGKDFFRDSMPDPVTAARQGYVVIVQDTRGRFTSDGDWRPFDCEAEDGFDTIAWAAGLPYADGQVGMFGLSYFGFTQWAAATLQPPALRAMVPYITWADPLNGFTYRGGAFELGVKAWWHFLVGLDVIARRHRATPETLKQAVAEFVREFDGLGRDGYQFLPLAEFAPLKRHSIGEAFFEDLAAPHDRSLFASQTILGKHAAVQVPTLNVGGWYDLFLADTITNFTAMRDLGRPAKLLIGPWSHGARRNPVGELGFGIGSESTWIDLQMDLGSLQLRWFDHWLKNINTGMMDEPPVKLFVMGANIWRDEETWPLSRARNVSYYLHAGAQLSPVAPGAELPDIYVHDPSDPVPTRGGAHLLTVEYPSGAWDQRSTEARPDVLVYRTPPLEQDVEVTGPITVHLWAVSSTPDTDFVARLTDVYPDGRSINLVDGIIRARHRDFAQGEPPSLIEPGRPYEYSIDLWATSNVFRAGHRIGVQITSSNFPRWDRNPNTGHPFGVDAELRVAQQTILHDHEHPSHVVLPVVPAS